MLVEVCSAASRALLYDGHLRVYGEDAEELFRIFVRDADAAARAFAAEHVVLFDAVFDPVAVRKGGGQGQAFDPIEGVIPPPRAGKRSATRAQMASNQKKLAAITASFFHIQA